LHSQNSSPTIPYSSIPHSFAASAHPLDEPNRFRYSSLTTGARSTVGAPRSRLGRTSPETSPRSPPTNGDLFASVQDSRRHRRSTLSTVRSSREPSASEATERVLADAERARLDGTESTLSTTAPSTVWDELDDLKSRIRKLEITGKLPPSSQAAISGVNQERPRTATTTPTTSPRHYRKASIPSADAENAVQNPVHPLLQSALTKAKAVLTSDVYMALEATIGDALALSTMLGVNTAPSGSMSVVNGVYSSPERHARRKADSVCRGLTELCLALTDEQLKRGGARSSPTGGAQQPQRSNGGVTGSAAPTYTYQRAPSHEPEGVERLERRQSTSSRLPSRLEARRASLISQSPGTPVTDTKPAPSSPGAAPPPSRLHRISTSLRTRRPPADEENRETATPHNRSLSRAFTEIGTPSPAQSVSPQQRFSRGYSVSRSSSIAGVQNQETGPGVSPRSAQFQPLTPSQAPSSLPRTPSTLSQTGIPFRRTYATPSVYSPATSRPNIQAGSRRYGLSPVTPGSGAEDSPRPPQLEPSQTRISMPSSKTVTSYTPIQPPRLRTNSLGTRRFGLRRRSAVMPDTADMDDSID